MELNDHQLIAVAVTVICLVAGILFYFSRKGGVKKVESVYDMSVGLKKEENATEKLSSSAVNDKVLNPAIFRQFKVLKTTKVSHNTKLIRFEIPHGRPLGLTIGRHISVKAEIDGNKVIRAYTPTSRPDQTGFFDLLIKRYEFGKMSNYMHSLRVGQSLDVRGPVGRFKYSANSYQRIGLIAGGTGLTPCLQVITYILQCPAMKHDKTNFTLFFQNRSEDDILLHDDLEALVKTHKNRLSIEYFLSNPRSKTYGKTKNERSGYINEETINEFLRPEVCQLVCMSGPSGFNECMKDMLVKVGHIEDESIYIW